ncbi:MAG: ferrous iron transport protein B [Lachnospiraceae bacterium]|nr:ferrous iron transport protein B [Lachnospiraceae bacterium]
MSIKVALAGNPNCGKTTLFNILTGSNQYVGNWPGVTVEKKEGHMIGHEDFVIVDLPGIYSLSPYTMDEVVTREYLVDEKPDVILDIVDGNNLERNLYLTTQLLELGIPTVIAINMMDIVRKKGDTLDIEVLSKRLGCPIGEISALKEEGINEIVDMVISVVGKLGHRTLHNFSGSVEHALAHIEEAVVHEFPEAQQRWYAIKIFERDPRIIKRLKVSKDVLKHIEEDISLCETELDDDAESIITNERYNYISSILKGCYDKKSEGLLDITDKIDRIVTHRFLALPIFVLVMLGVYTISMGTIGKFTVDFMNDTVFGEWLIPGVTYLLTKVGCADWVISLVSEGVIGGAGSVLSFVPQLLILFFLLSVLEDVGYMSRVAFIMDKLFRKFGLSGKSFIPLLVSSGCGVPGVMSTRTIESDRDRRMTIMTTCFIPCGAKMPMVGLIAGALFGNSAWIATSAYLMGVFSVALSGFILKKTKLFEGDPAPFVMELPAYHLPSMKNVLRTTKDRGLDFVKRAGTVIVAASMAIWVLNSFSFDGGFHFINDGTERSVLAAVGSVIAVVFIPLGFGHWETALATLLGLLAKEQVVSVLGSLAFMSGVSQTAGESARLAYIGEVIFNGNGVSAYAFMIFNLLCMPCVAAMGAIAREMKSKKWTVIALSYMTLYSYVISLIIYQMGSFFAGKGFNVWTGIAILLILLIVFLVARPVRRK